MYNSFRNLISISWKKLPLVAESSLSILRTIRRIFMNVDWIECPEKCHLIKYWCYFLLEDIQHQLTLTTSTTHNAIFKIKVGNSSYFFLFNLISRLNWVSFDVVITIILAVKVCQFFSERFRLLFLNGSYHKKVVCKFKACIFEL